MKLSHILADRSSARIFFGLRPSAASAEQLLQWGQQLYANCGQQLRKLFDKQPGLQQIFVDEHKLGDYFQENRVYAPQDFHVTLYFLGEQSAALIDALCAQMLTLQPAASVLTLKTSALGFLPYHKPRVLLQHVQPHPQLSMLREQVAALMRANGVDPDTREFKPHLSLMRLKTVVCQAIQQTLLAELQSTRLQKTLTFEALVLYASQAMPVVTQKKDQAQRYIGLAELPLFIA